MEQHCKTQRERARRGEVPVIDETGRSRGDTRQGSEIPRHVVRKAVRINEVDFDGHLKSLLRKGILAKRRGDIGRWSRAEQKGLQPQAGAS